MKFFGALSIWATCATTVSAFGQLGHYVIGETTYTLLPDTVKSTISTCKYIDQFNGSMGKASIWADTIKRNPRFRWTSPLHYYDVDNDPPLYCANLTLPENKKDLNLINGVRRSLVNITLSPLQNGVKCGSFFHFNMLIHILQDMYQPLHLTGKERGGNERYFSHGGITYNLHKFWDSDVLKLALNDELGEDFNWTDAVEYFYKETKDKVKDIICAHEKPIDVETVMLKLVEDAKPVSQLNCDVVWRFTDDDYMEQSKDLVKKLITNAILALYCTLLQVG